MDGDFLLEMGEKSFGLRGGDLSPLYSLMLKTLRATPLTARGSAVCAPVSMATDSPPLRQCHQMDRDI
jgi:hypothetical protein